MNNRRFFAHDFLFLKKNKNKYFYIKNGVASILKITSDALIVCAMVVSSLLFSCSFCHNADTISLPSSLSKAIDLFYLENNNEKVLKKINATRSVKPLENVSLLCTILSSAAVCELGKYDSAAHLLQQADTIAIKQNPYVLFFYNSIKGLLLFRQGNFSCAYTTLSRALDEKYDERAVGLNKRLLARISLSKNDYKQGMEWLLQSSYHFSKCNLPKSVAVNEKIIAHFYMLSNNYQAAFQHLKAAEAGLKKSPDAAELFYVNINYIDYYITKGDLNRAEWYANKCLAQCENTGNIQMKTLVYDNLGEIALRRHDALTAIRFFKKNFDIPLVFTGALSWQIVAHIYMSQAYIELNRNDNALRLAKKAVSLARRSPPDRYKAYNNLAQILTIMNQDHLAYCYLDSASLIRDDMVKASAGINNAYYETKIDLDQAVSGMKLMSMKHHKQFFTYLLSVVVLFLVVILLYLVVCLQRKRNHALKELVDKNIKIIEAIDKQKEAAQLLKRHNKSAKISDDERSGQLFKSLCTWLETQRNFCRNDLSLELVAKELNTNRDYLSKAINEQQLHFNDLIYKYRVEEVIRILSDKNDRRSRYTLRVLANEVGFNSDSVFIDAFKKFTGLSPMQFRKNLPQN